MAREMVGHCLRNMLVYMKYTTANCITALFWFFPLEIMHLLNVFSRLVLLRK